MDLSPVGYALRLHRRSSFGWDRRGRGGVGVPGVDDEGLLGGDGSYGVSGQVSVTGITGHYTHRTPSVTVEGSRAPEEPSETYKCGVRVHVPSHGDECSCRLISKSQYFSDDRIPISQNVGSSLPAELNSFWCSRTPLPRVFLGTHQKVKT